MASNTKTPVMVLHELSTKRKLAPPIYNIVIQQQGTHVNRFDYIVSVASIEGYGTGTSKQIAKHNAATDALQKLESMGEYNPFENPVGQFHIGVKTEPTHSQQPQQTITKLDYVAPLMTFCMDNKVPTPEFLLISDVGPPHAREFTFECRVSSIRTEAKGLTKKAAKHLAAKEMLEKIKDIVPDLCNTEEPMDSENAIKKFNELREFYPDKCIKVEDYNLFMKRLLDSKEITVDDALADFNMDNLEESFNKVCTKFELQHDFFTIQQDPTMVALSISTDIPFCIIGMGKSEQEAKNKALRETLDKLKYFLQLF